MLSLSRLQSSTWMRLPPAFLRDCLAPTPANRGRGIGKPEPAAETGAHKTQAARAQLFLSLLIKNTNSTVWTHMKARLGLHRRRRYVCAIVLPAQVSRPITARS